MRTDSWTYAILVYLVIPVAITIGLAFAIIAVVNFFFPETLAYNWQTVLAVYFLMLLPKWLGLAKK